MIKTFSAHKQPYLGVIHVPQQAALLSVQDEVTAQEPAAVLILLDVQEAAEAILSVHVRHRNPDQLSPLWGITGTLHTHLDTSVKACLRC